MITFSPTGVQERGLIWSCCCCKTSHLTREGQRSNRVVPHSVTSRWWRNSSKPLLWLATFWFKTSFSHFRCILTLGHWNSLKQALHRHSILHYMDGWLSTQSSLQKIDLQHSFLGSMCNMACFFHSGCSCQLFSSGGTNYGTIIKYEIIALQKDVIWIYPCQDSLAINVALALVYICRTWESVISCQSALNFPIAHSHICWLLHHTFIIHWEALLSKGGTFKYGLLWLCLFLICCCLAASSTPASIFWSVV